MTRSIIPLLVTLISAWLLPAPPAAAQNTWHVDDVTCPGLGDGSLGNPFCSIQDAIDIASNGDEVVVEIGFYGEAIDFLGKAITVRSTDPSDPAVVNATIIQGTMNGSLHIVQCINGEGPDSVLAGFTITNGNANGVNPTEDVGGGMLNLNSSPTVTCCIFLLNAANQGGGAMYNEGGSPTVTGCDFFFNSCANDNGGAIWNDNATPQFDNCLVRWNTAANLGGGMYNSNGSNATISHCEFEANEAVTRGGGMANFNSSPTITDSSFIANISPSIGGAAILNDASAPVIARCLIRSNSGPPPSMTGGGIANLNGLAASIVDTTICGNLGVEIVSFSAPPYTDGGGNVIEDNCLPDKSQLPTGACCVDGNCVTLSAADCTLVGGVYQGDDTNCGAVVCPAACPGDVNGDGAVTVVDLLQLLGAWGGCP